MKLEIDLRGLWENVRRMGAEGPQETIRFPPRKADAPPRNTVITDPPTGTTGEPGIAQPTEPAVPIEGGALSEESFKIVEGPGGLLQKDGQQIMMYMPGHYPERFEKALQDGNDGNRMHVAFCIHLEKMKQNGRTIPSTSRPNGLMINSLFMTTKAIVRATLP